MPITQLSGMLKYENHDTFIGTFSHGVLNREGKLTLVSKAHLTAEGTWKDGLMDGEMNLSTDVSKFIYGQNLASFWIYSFQSKIQHQ